MPGGLGGKARPVRPGSRRALSRACRRPDRHGRGTRLRGGRHHSPYPVRADARHRQTTCDCHGHRLALGRSHDRRRADGRTHARLRHRSQAAVPRDPKRDHRRRTTARPTGDPHHGNLHRNGQLRDTAAAPGGPRQPGCRGNRRHGNRRRRGDPGARRRSSIRGAGHRSHLPDLQTAGTHLRTAYCQRTGSPRIEKRTHGRCRSGARRPLHRRHAGRCPTTTVPVHGRIRLGYLRLGCCHRGHSRRCHRCPGQSRDLHRDLHRDRIPSRIACRHRRPTGCRGDRNTRHGCRLPRVSRQSPCHFRQRHRGQQTRGLSSHRFHYHRFHYHYHRCRFPGLRNGHSRPDGRNRRPFRYYRPGVRARSQRRHAEMRCRLRPLSPTS